jgi:hypothetical protein
LLRTTKTQTKLIEEIHAIQGGLGLDLNELVGEHEGRERTILLEITRNRLIATAILEDYVWFDEGLASIIARYFFGRRSFIELWRTRRFQRFNHFILERLYLLQKLALVKDLMKVPREVVTYMVKLNDLRNAVAHSFFPENLRGKRTTYRGVDIFTLGRFEMLMEDRQPAADFIMRRAYNA